MVRLTRREKEIYEEIYQRTNGLMPSGENLIKVFKEYEEKLGYKRIPSDIISSEMSRKFSLYVADRKRD